MKERREGIALLEEAIIYGAITGLKPWDYEITVEHFFNHRHRLVWEAIDALRGKGKDVTVLSLSKELESSGKLESVGGSLFLTSIGEDIPFCEIFRVKENCQLLREFYQESQFQKQVGKIVKSKNLTQDEKMDMLEKAQDHLEASVEKGKSWYEASESAKEYLEWELKQEESKRLPFGIPTIDKLLEGGIVRGYYGILGARPGSGKSTIGMNLMSGLARQHEVVYVTLEMSRFRIIKNMLAANRQKTLNDLHSGEYKITFVESGRTIPELQSITGRLLQEKRRDIIIIDHFHLIEGFGEIAVDKYTNVSKSLLAMSRETGVAFLVLAQLSRGAATEAPKMKDLRGSGSLEEDADFVLLLHKIEENKSVLRLAKNRDTGEKGECKLTYNPETRELREGEILAPLG